MFSTKVHIGVIAAILLALPLSACLAPEVEETKPTDAQSLVDGLVYVKAKNGLCFGVGTTSRVSTGGTVAMSNVLVQVDCNSVTLSPTVVPQTTPASAAASALGVDQ